MEPSELAKRWKCTRHTLLRLIALFPARSNLAHTSEEDFISTQSKPLVAGKLQRTQEIRLVFRKLIDLNSNATSGGLNSMEHKRPLNRSRNRSNRENINTLQEHNTEALLLRHSHTEINIFTHTTTHSRGLL